MKASLKLIASVLPIVLLVVGACRDCSGCMDFQLKAKDGTTVEGRTLEFPSDLDSKLVINPRGISFQSPAPSGGNGLKWTNKFGYYGMNAFGMPITFDGMNEKGLSFGALWLPGYTEYESVGAGEQSCALANTVLGDWILGNFSNVDEVRAALKDLKVWGQKMPQFGNQPAPIHLAVNDASGKSIVIEFVGGSKQIYDNPVHVLTNAPPFPWHLINLRNYVQLSPLDPGAKTEGGQVYQSPGAGGGLLGLPGDWSPPSRFIRICALVLFSLQPKDAKSAVSLTSHIINAEDIPIGVIREPSAQGVEYGYTQWSVIKDQRNKIIYFRAYGDLGFKAYPMSDYDLGEGAKQRTVTLQ
jgi:choloylglycine hydrolase